MLHTINKSPFEKNSLTTCLRLARPGSDILLLEDGVYGAMPGTKVSEMVESALRDNKVYALASDLDSRGIDQSSLLRGIEVVDYHGFVELATRNEKVQSWL